MKALLSQIKVMAQHIIVRVSKKINLEHPPKLMKIAFSVILLISSGCSRTCFEQGDHVANLVGERIGKDVVWNQSCCQDAQIQCYIQELLENPLTAESAIQIALLNNPQVQTLYEEVGIAYADFVEAGLITNPFFAVETRFPLKKGLKTNIEYDIMASLLDVFLIPLRVKLASVELEQAQLKVANGILALAFDVRSAYYELLATEQKLFYTKEIAELTDISAEIASRQAAVANIGQLEWEMIQASYLEEKIEVARSEVEIIKLKEILNRLLGLCEDHCIELSQDPLTNQSLQEFSLCCLENVAVQERLDLQAARYETIGIARQLGLKEWWTYSNLQAGLAGERDTDGTNTLGFGVAGEIPLFNDGQAARKRIFAQLRQSQDRMAALEIQVLSEVRESYKQIKHHLGMIQEYREAILPLQQKIIQSSEQLFNVMDLGAYRLIDNKKHELQARRHYIELLKDYSLAQVQLDRSLGGNLFRLMTDEGFEQ